MNTRRGFSLMELMIAMAVVAILAAIAYPSYQRQLARGARADAHTALAAVANRQEQYFYDHRSYTTSTSDLGFAASYTTEGGHYLITLAAPDGGSLNTGFVATATAQGVQASRDADCLTLTINAQGDRGGTSTDCWR